MQPVKLFIIPLIILLSFTDSITAQWIKTATIPHGQIRCIVFKDSSIYTGTYGGGIFVSKDNGASWDSINNGLTNKYIKSLSISGSSIFAGSDGRGVFKSTNNGATWDTINSGLRDSVILTLSFDNILLFAGSLTHGVYKSSDDGSTWAQSSNGLTNTTINVLTVIDTNIYAGTWGGGVFISSDKGNSWSGVYNDSMKSKFISGIAAIDTNLFVGTLNSGVLQNFPNQKKWKTKNTGLTAAAVYSLLANNKILFAGTDQGIFAILQNDSTWQSINSNMQAAVIRTMAVNGSYLYIGTDTGILYRALSDFILPAYVAGNQSDLPSHFQLDQNYPNPFNPSTTISYTVKEAGRVTLKVYDILGREIQTLVNKDLSPGRYKADFNAANLSTGVYLYRMQTEKYASTKKMILLR